MADKDLIMKRFSGASGSYDSSAVVQKAVASELASQIFRYVPEPFFSKVLEIGCGTGLLSHRLAEFIPSGNMYLNDICPEFASCVSDLHPAAFIGGDAESVDLPSGIGLIASSSVIQWFENPEKFFGKCRQSLRDGGYLAFSTFGPDNLKEIAEVTGNTLDYRPLEELGSMLSFGYELVYSDESYSQLHFPTPVDVLRHLKYTGVNGISRGIWTRKDLSGFCRSYMAKFGSGDGCTLTYHPIYIIVKKS